MKVFTYFCLSLLLLLLSCTYEPESDLFIDVKPGETKVTTFQFFNENVFNFRNAVSLNLAPSNGEDIVAYKLFLGTALIEEGEYPYFVTIDSKKFENGSYELTLVLTKRKQGESLAAMMGLELYDQEIKKTVTIFNGPLPKPKFKAITIENGILNIEWEKYPAYGFKQYVLRFGSFFHESTIITDINTTKISVPDYVGGLKSFSMTVLAYDEFADESILYDYPLNTTITKTASGVEFKWENGPFQNWNGVRVGVTKSDGTFEYHMVDKSLNEFVAPKQWEFPHNTDVYIETRNSINNGTVTMSSKEFSTSLSINAIQYQDVRNIFVGNDTDTAFTIFCQGWNPETDILIQHGRDLSHKELSRKTGIISASPDCKRIFEFNNNTVTRLDAKTFQPIESFNTSGLTGTYDQFRQLDVTNENYIGIYVRKGTVLWYYVFDWSTKNLVLSGTTTHQDLDKLGKLTSDGKVYFITSDDMFLDLTVIPNTMRRLFPVYGVYHRATLVDKMRSIYFKDNQLTLLGLNVTPPNDVLSTIPYPKNVRAGFTNNEDIAGFAYLENGYIKIDFFRTDNLTIIKTLETRFPSGWNYQFYLFGNKLIVIKESPEYYNSNVIELTF